MTKKATYLSCLLMATFLFVGCSTKKKDPHLVINEVMVINETGFMDNFGNRGSWIEIYNNTAGTKNIAGMFLTTDKNNPKMYAIPQGDQLTQIKPFQHVLFWADANQIRGTFHTSFTLNHNGDNYIALYDVDGTTLLDEISIPKSALAADKSYGYKVDGQKYDTNGNINATVLENVTPSSNNEVVGENPKLLELKKNDGKGFGLTLTSMLVVFTGLALLFLIYWNIGETAKWLSHKRAARSAANSEDARKGVSPAETSGDIIAAISAAIYELNQTQHDIESTILTIQQVRKDYSPWSSKIYNLRQLPRR